MKRYTYNGVTCQATKRRSSTRDGKKYMRTVRFKDSERLVHYGDPDMDMQRDNEERRASFLARHKCNEKKDPFSAGFWACYDWANTNEKSMNKNVCKDCDNSEPDSESSVELIEGVDTPRTTKMISEDDGHAIIGMYGVVHGGADLTGETFGRDTDFGKKMGLGADVYIDHTFSSQVNGYIAKGESEAKDYYMEEIPDEVGQVIRVTPDDFGLYMELQFEKSNRYWELVRRMYETGRLGASSGADHRARKSADGKITRWKITELSLTMEPAEPRIVGTALRKKAVGLDTIKSLLEEVVRLQSEQEQVDTVIEILEESANPSGLGDYAKGLDYEISNDSASASLTGEYTFGITSDNTASWSMSTTYPAVPIDLQNRPVCDELVRHTGLLDTKETKKEIEESTDSDSDILATEDEQVTEEVTKSTSRIEFVENTKQMENDEMNQEIDEKRFDALEAAVANTSKSIERLTNLVMHNSGEFADAGVAVAGGQNDRPETKSLLDLLTAIRLGDEARMKNVYKSQLSTDGSTGGYLIEEAVLRDLVPNISLNSPLTSLVRSIPVPAPSGRVPLPDYYQSITAGVGQTATGQGVTPQTRSEGGAYTKETARVSQLEYRVYDSLSGYVQASREISRYAPAIENILVEAIQEAIVARKEHFILNGTGSNGQPLGVLNWSGAIGITPDTNSVFAYADMLEMQSRLIGRTSGSPIWVAHPSMIPDIGSFEIGSNGAGIPMGIGQANGMNTMPATNIPLIFSQHLPQADARGCVVLMDASLYGLFEYESVYIQFSDQYDFVNGLDTWRFGQLIDGKPLMKDNVTLGGEGSAYTQSMAVYFND